MHVWSVTSVTSTGTTTSRLLEYLGVLVLLGLAGARA